jgi:hypothetical protein
LALNSRIGPRLNAAAVVPDLLRRAGAAHGLNPYRYYLRLRECAQPAHLAGWDLLAPAELRPVLADATVRTGMAGRSSTVEFDQKKAAWDILLCRGDPAALPPFADAVAGEASGYVINRFLELAGCLALEALPPEVPDLLAARTRESWPEEELLVAQLTRISHQAP